MRFFAKMYVFPSKKYRHRKLSTRFCRSDYRVQATLQTKRESLPISFEISLTAVPKSILYKLLDKYVSCSILPYSKEKTLKSDIFLYDKERAIDGEFRKAC